MLVHFSGACMNFCLQAFSFCDFVCNLCVTSVKSAYSAVVPSVIARDCFDTVIDVEGKFR
jgi:hypothetical protein